MCGRAVWLFKFKTLFKFPRTENTQNLPRIVQNSKWLTCDATDGRVHVVNRLVFGVNKCAYPTIGRVRGGSPTASSPAAAIVIIHQIHVVQVHLILIHMQRLMELVVSVELIVVQCAARQRTYSHVAAYGVGHASVLGLVHRALRVARVSMMLLYEEVLLLYGLLYAAVEIDDRVGKGLVAEYGAVLVFLASLYVDVQVVGIFFHVVRIDDAIVQIQVDRDYRLVLGVG